MHFVMPLARGEYMIALVAFHNQLVRAADKVDLVGRVELQKRVVKC
jgi:hypothetical protein